MSLRRLTIKKPCRRIIVKWIERLIVMLLLFTPSPSPSLPLSLAVSVPFFLFFLCASVGAVKSKYSDETRCCCYLLRKIHCLRRIKKATATTATTRHTWHVCKCMLCYHSPGIRQQNKYCERMQACCIVCMQWVSVRV